MDRPNPVPRPISFVVKKGSNACSITSWLIPVPVSRNAMRTQSQPAISSGSPALPAPILAVSISRVPPCGIASRALIAMFKSADSI